ncbi:aminoglycoside phosphotransferase (APT) family kinase protein [Micromonospora vinacea]|uniref:Aminoglycoside phosphotransferase (APT) family kinase protein n=1 Tax=Micromonospora vinacea TaxID=709878 RepID=A0ABS0K6E0_9ACTN|nr:aminoglycoside phosphotransferase family protein [Micromonospora vinacea]MBG6104145.1 aminoglycoside phosphotransferase (APT) family kinase protein [Micromonospora vinacea]
MSYLAEDQAAGVLRQWIGTAAPKLLGEGMEGAVYEVDDSRVAKIWFAGSVESSRRAAAFYDALAAKPLTFQVPRITQVESVGGRVVTIERRLTGTTLAAALAAGAVSREDAYAIVVDIVAALATGGGLQAAREMTVLGEDSPLFSAGEGFAVALARLAERRGARFRQVLSGAVVDFERKAAALSSRLVEVDSGRRAVLHGDLVPGNILVEASGRPSAVLDWGFLTTEGDPAFDAAVTAAIFDMYGPEAAHVERDLLDRFEARLRADRAALLVYRAAYSLITANAYDPTGQDGHFAWCVAALNRSDVTEALLG